MPIEAASFADILGREPESAIVGRVDAHACIVAPAIRIRLRAGAGHGRLLGCHLVERVSGTPTRETDRGGGLRGRYAVAHQDVLRLIHGYTGHPAESAVRRVRALLKYRGRSVRVPYLVPAHA